MSGAVAKLACLVLSLLPAAAAEELKVGFVNNPARDGGDLVLIHPGLSPQFFPQDKTGFARVEVTELKPDLPGVLQDAYVNYEIRGGKLTARVPFKGSRQQAVAFTLTRHIPDNNGNEKRLVASDSIAPVRGEVSPEQKKADTSKPTGQETEPGKTQTAALELSTGTAVQVRSLERVSLTLGANRKEQVKILIQDSSTGETRLEQKAEVDAAKKTIELDMPVGPNLVLMVRDEQGHTLYEQPLESESLRVAHRAQAFSSLNFGLLLAALIVLVYFAVGQWLNQRKKKQRLPKIGAGTSLDEIRSWLENAIAKSDSAYSTAARALKIANQAQRAVETVPKGPDEQTVRGIVTAGLERRLGSDSEPSSLVAVAGPPGGTAVPPPADPEQSLLAVVDYWLELRSRDRAELVRMAEKIGLRTQLYAHRNLTRLFSDITRFVYEFEPSERDGGWLWVAGSDGEEFLAVPTDAAFFQVGKAPDVLDRLFEGMQRASDVFQFRRIFRPCHLRRSPDGSGYILVKKGCLQLEGDPAPSVPLPPAYNDLLASITAQCAAASGGQPLAETLRTALLGLSESLQRAQADIDDLRQQLAQSQKQNGKLAEIEAALAALRPKLEEILTRAAPAPAPSAAGESLVVRALRHQVDARIGALEAELLKLRDRLNEVAAKLKEEAPQEGEGRPSKPGEKAVPTSGGEPASGEAAGAGQVEPAVEGREPTAPAGMAAESGKLPEAWREALRTAALRYGSAARSEQVSKAHFLRRLIGLTQVLSDAADPAASPVRIVHLRVQGEEFEIHDTELIPGNSEELLCKRCQVPHCFQLAVCAGTAGDEAVSLLYPLGVLVPSNYPAGYINLVEGLPGTLFLIGDVLQPARLAELQGEGRVHYRVLQKLKWSGD
jgi:hypothetical protein